MGQTVDAGATGSRSWSVQVYRYGFNDQEKETELAEDLYSAFFWEYDSRLARRWNLDPRPNVSISVYCVFNNNPISFSDLLGDTVKGDRRLYDKYKAFYDDEKNKLFNKISGLYETAARLQRQIEIMQESNWEGYDNKILELQSQLNGINAMIPYYENQYKKVCFVLDKMKQLEESVQIVNIVVDPELNDKHGITTYDMKTHVLEIYIGTCEFDEYTFQHELGHIFQYFDRQVSFDFLNGVRGILYSRKDECNAMNYAQPYFQEKNNDYKSYAFCMKPKEVNWNSIDPATGYTHGYLVAKSAFEAGQNKQMGEVFYGWEKFYNFGKENPNLEFDLLIFKKLE